MQPLPLGVLARAESHALLAKYRPDLAENTILDAIAEALGDLPLTLHLAGSFLKSYQHHERLGNPAYYLQQLARPDLLNHPSMQGKGAEWNPTGHEQHVARTFALSYERLDKRDRVDALALALLARAAYFAPGEPIPRALLIATLELPTEDDAAAMQAENALARLLALARFLWEQIDRIHASNYAGPALLLTGVLEESVRGTIYAYSGPLMSGKRELMKTLGTLGKSREYGDDNWRQLDEKIVRAGHWQAAGTHGPNLPLSDWIDKVARIASIRNQAAHVAQVEAATFQTLCGDYFGGPRLGLGTLNGLLLAWGP